MPSTVYSLGGALCGIVLAHVDDFQIGGGRSNHNFKTTLDHLKGLYKWGKWVDDANGYKVSGINVQRTQDRGFHLDMEGYTKSVEPMSIPGPRKKQTDDRITTREHTQTLAILGQGQWLAVQMMPQVASLISQIQGMLPEFKVKDLGLVNQLVRWIHTFASTGITIHPLHQVNLDGWHDATWCSRPDLSSQGAYLICATTPEALDGARARFNPIAWASKKLPRVSRSSLSSEVQAGGECLEKLEFIQVSWRELGTGQTQIGNTAQRTANLKECAPAHVITDCKSIYDAINVNTSACLGLSDKRAAVEAKAMKEAFENSPNTLRWVHSHAQLADGLTKYDIEAIRLLNDFILNGIWRLVHDPEFESARKGFQKTLKVLETKKQHNLGHHTTTAETKTWQ